MSEHYRRRSPEELHAQITEASHAFGEQLIPPTAETDSANEQALFASSAETLRTRYPLRYDAYLATLRSLRRGESDAERMAVLDVVAARQRMHDLAEMREWMHMLNHLDAYIAEEGAHLREHQTTAFEDIRVMLERGERAGYMKLPTGSGKTVIFIEVVRALDGRTLIVTSRKDLIVQTLERIAQFAPEVDVGAVYSDQKAFGHRVTMTTYDSFVSNTKSGNLQPSDFDVVVLDEAHNALAPEARRTVQRYDHAIRIGFTATPDYAQNKKLKHLLPYPIHEMHVREAAEEGVLCGFRCWILETDVDLSSVPNVAGAFNRAELARAVNAQARNEKAAELYVHEFFLPLMKKGMHPERAIAFCTDIAHACEFANILRQRGVHAAAYHSELPREERQSLLTQFKRGDVHVLTNPEALIEGFDDPGVSVCLNLDPTMSVVQAEQRAGRVLRIDPNNPTKVATIVDCLDKDAKGRAVLFSAIVSAAAVLPRHATVGGGGGGGGAGTVPPMHIPGLVIHSNTKDVLDITQRQNAKRAPEIPPDWMSIPKLARALKVHENVLRTFIAGARAVRPDLARDRTSSAGATTTFCDPDLHPLLDAACKRPSMISPALSNALADAVGIAPVVLRADALRDLLNGAPDVLLHETKHVLEHAYTLDAYRRIAANHNLLPEVVDDAVVRVALNDLTARGWFTSKHVESIITSVGSALIPTLRDAHDAIIAQHPDWVKRFTQRGVVHTRASPDLIRAIRQEHTRLLAASRAEANVLRNRLEGDGWQLIATVAHSIGVTEDFIRNELTNLAVTDDPEWALALPGNPMMLSPIACALFREAATQRLGDRAAWPRMEDVARKLHGVTPDEMERVLRHEKDALVAYGGVTRVNPTVAKDYFVIRKRVWRERRNRRG